jgi:hypothetical protein
MPIMSSRPVDRGIVQPEAADVDHAAPGLAFIDRLGLQVQFALVGVVVKEATEVFQGVDVDILAGRHLFLL